MENVYHTTFISTAIASSVGDINPSCEAFFFFNVFNKYTLNTHYCLRLSLPWWLGSMSVHVCQLRSLMKRSHKYSTGKYLEPSLEISSRTNLWFFGEPLYFFICQDRAYTQDQTCPGFDECGGAGSILPLTDNQCDFNLNHMNQRLPRAEIKYI